MLTLGFDPHRRQHQTELMDDPNLDVHVHKRALSALARINRISLSANMVWPVIRSLAKKERHGPLRVLDIACGGGDVLCQLANWARAAGLEIAWHGWDCSPVSIEVAQSAAAKQGCSIEFQVRDVIRDAFDGEFDVVMCSLFLHHLRETDAVALLKKMSDAAKSSVLVNDLRRTLLGYAMASIGCKLLTRSHIVHVDGPRSVASAFTEAEARRLAHQAGLENVVVTRHWPQRFLLRWNRPE